MSERDSRDRPRLSERIVDDYEGYRISDERGEKIGKVEYTVLDDRVDQPAFLAVNTGFLGMNTALIPAELISLGDRDREINARTEESHVKSAPVVGSADEITPELERQTLEHFGLGNSSDETLHNESRQEEPHDDSRNDRDNDRGNDPSMSRDRDMDDRDIDRDRDRSSDDRDRSSGAGAPAAGTAAGGAAGAAASRSGDRHDDREARDEREYREERDAREEVGGRGGERPSDSETRVPGDDRSISGASSGLSGGAGGNANRVSSGSGGFGSGPETIRVTVKRERARAERVRGEDGQEEVRIRKQVVEEEELIEVEDRI